MLWEIAYLHWEKASSEIVYSTGLFFLDLIFFFYKICKIGNPGRMICLNSWLYPIVSLWQDYRAGEVYTIGNAPTHPIIENGSGRGLQAHSLIVRETGNWLHTDVNSKIPSPHLKANDLVGFISQSKGKGPVTINIQIYQDGRISDEALHVELVKKQLEIK